MYSVVLHVFRGPTRILPLSKERHGHPPEVKMVSGVSWLLPNVHRASEGQRHQWKHWSRTEGIADLSKSGGSMGPVLEVGCSS